MVVVMEREATQADIDAVAERVRSMGGEAFVSRGTVHTIIGLVGDTERFSAVDWKQLPGVDHVIHIGKPYKMVAADRSRPGSPIAHLPFGRLPSVPHAATMAAMRTDFGFWFAYGGRCPA